MGTIQQLLGGPRDDKVPYILRMHQPGDMGWITHRQVVLYHQEYGWDETYEALIGEIISSFIKQFDSRYERASIRLARTPSPGTQTVCGQEIRRGRQAMTSLRRAFCARPRDRRMPCRRVHPVRTRQKL